MIAVEGGLSEPVLEELYRELIVEHYRSPHNRRSLPDADVRSEGMNPLCGDEIGLELRFAGERVAEAAFHGSGCALSMASASLLTDAIGGLSAGEITRLREAFERMLKEGSEPEPELGDLEVFQGVSRFPVRIKCVLLPWKVLRDALDEYEDQHDDL